MTAPPRILFVVTPLLASTVACGPRAEPRAATGPRAPASADATPSRDGGRTTRTREPPAAGSGGEPAGAATTSDTTHAGPSTSTPPFPPQDFPPPSAKSAAPGDGHWTPLGDAALGERAAATPMVIARTVVHPHPDSRWITVTIAAVALSGVRVGWTAGTEDLAWAKLPVTAASGLVPEADRDALVAVMNGGFQPRHGRWGVMGGGATLTPPRPEGCTLALYLDGSVRLAPWPELASEQDRMSVIRQTPPCLVHTGAVNPTLASGRDKAWAGHAADLQTRRRSAVGLDASGRILFYAIGEEADPRWLAEGLRAAGAATAAQLDINWYWTRFLLFGKVDREPMHVTSTLIPKMEHLPTGYVERASTRDFFYFVRK